MSEKDRESFQAAVSKLAKTKDTQRWFNATVGACSLRTLRSSLCCIDLANRMPASKLLANLQDACERYELHRELKAQSATLYAALTNKHKKFIRDWIGAATDACPGEYCGLSESQVLERLAAAWAPIFEKAPALKRPLHLYRAVGGDHARAIAALQVGHSVTLDRHSSFAHSPDMVRKYGMLLLDPDDPEPICIMCVKVPKGTRFVYLGGMERTGGLGGVDRAKGLDDIDRTQGETVLAPPLRLKKTARNARARNCEGVMDERYDRTHRLSVVTMTATKDARTGSLN